MSISIGDINIIDSAINSEYKIIVLEKIIERLLQTTLVGTLTSQDVEKIRNEAIELLQKKYPTAGITKQNK